MLLLGAVSASRWDSYECMASLEPHPGVSFDCQSLVRLQVVQVTKQCIWGRAKSDRSSPLAL